MGQARIGIAISDEMEILASSVESYHCMGDVKKDAAAVAEKLQALGTKKVVIGLAKNMNGTEGPAAEKCRAFGAALKDANVSRKKRKGVVDKLAAQLILQNYLDFQGGAH